MRGGIIRLLPCLPFLILSLFTVYNVPLIMPQCTHYVGRSGPFAGGISTPTAHSYPSGSRTSVSRQPCPLSLVPETTVAPYARARRSVSSGSMPNRRSCEAQSALLAGHQIGVPGMFVVGVVGMQHHFGRTDSRRAEVDIVVMHFSSKDGLIKATERATSVTIRFSDNGGSNAPKRKPGIHGSPWRNFVPSILSFTILISRLYRLDAPTDMSAVDVARRTR